MPQYSYEAIGNQNKVVRGIAEAERPEDVVTLLRETGLYAYSVRPHKPVTLFRISKRRSVRTADLVVLTRQFATLLDAGIPVTESLSILARQTSNNSISTALTRITSEVRGGSSLADAFSKHPGIFDNLFVSMLQAGEMGGNLIQTMSRLSEHLEKEKKLRDNIKSAANYPKVVGAFAAVMFVVMMVFMVPSFKGFATEGTEIPAITLFIYSVSDSMRDWWYIWIAAIFLIVFLAMAFFQSRVGNEMWEKRKLRLPLFGSLLSKTVISRFVRTLSTLLRGGVPIVRALETSGPTCGSSLVANAVEAAAREIEVGRTISKPLAASGLFPPMVIEMISIGEETGNLPDMLDKISEFYDEEVETESKRLGTTMEPLLLILVGGIVGVMLIALYLPMFSSVLSYS
jgi:type IV pilus assembly protein PilC